MNFKLQNLVNEWLNKYCPEFADLSLFKQVEWYDKAVKAVNIELKRAA